MAIGVGDIVLMNTLATFQMYRNGGPIKGIATAVAAGPPATADVQWENGTFQAGVERTALRERIGDAPAGVTALLGTAFRVGSAQELEAVLVNALLVDNESLSDDRGLAIFAIIINGNFTGDYITYLDDVNFTVVLALPRLPNARSARL